MSMRRIGIGSALLFVVAILIAAGGCGRGAKSPAPIAIGAPVTVTQAVSIHDLSASPATFVGQKIRLEGTVSKVCQGSGCWVEVAAADGSTFLARSLDHSILAPTDCAGRRVIVQGVVTEIPPEVSEEPVPEDHECPRPTYLVATEGIELR